MMVFPEGKIVTTSELLTNVPGKITMTHAGPTRSFGPAPEGRILTKDLPTVDVNHGMFLTTTMLTLKVRKNWSFSQNKSYA